MIRLGAASIPWIYELTRPGVRRHARAFGLRDRVYYWVEDARAAGWPDLPAPFGYLGEPVYLPGLSDEVFSDPAGQPALGIEDADVLDLGTRHEVIRVPCAGETLSCTTTIVSVEAVTTGVGPGARVVREMSFRDQAGELVLRQLRRTLYFQGARDDRS